MEKRSNISSDKIQLQIICWTHSKKIKDSFDNGIHNDSLHMNLCTTNPVAFFTSKRIISIAERKTPDKIGSNDHFDFSIFNSPTSEKLKKKEVENDTDVWIAENKNSKSKLNFNQLNLCDFEHSIPKQTIKSDNNILSFSDSIFHKNANPIHFSNINMTKESVGIKCEKKEFSTIALNNFNTDEKLKLIIPTQFQYFEFKNQGKDLIQHLNQKIVHSKDDLYYQLTSSSNVEKLTFDPPLISKNHDPIKNHLFSSNSEFSRHFKQRMELSNNEKSIDIIHPNYNTNTSRIENPNLIQKRHTKGIKSRFESEFITSNNIHDEEQQNKNQKMHCQELFNSNQNWDEVFHSSKIPQSSHQNQFSSNSDVCLSIPTSSTNSIIFQDHHILNEYKLYSNENNNSNHKLMHPELHYPKIGKNIKGEYIFMDFEKIAKQIPAIPIAIPAPYSYNDGRGTLERILDNPHQTTNVYIRGFHPSTTDLMLEHYGSRYGHIESAKSIIDHLTNTCKGYGFIKFQNLFDSENCIRGFHYMGYEAKFAKLGHNARLKTLGSPNNTNLYISNLPRKMNDRELAELFQSAHSEFQVLSQKILRDSHGLSRGVGFARFKSPLICDRVIDLFHGKKIGNSEDFTILQLRYADTNQQKMLKMETTHRRIFKTNEYNTVVYGLGSPYFFESPISSSLNNSTKIGISRPLGIVSNERIRRISETKTF